MARKAAAKKAAPKQEAPQVEPMGDLSWDPPPERVDVLGEFPLPEGHYFYVPVTSARAHTGRFNNESVSVMALQRRVGAVQTGLFDSATADAVSSWKQQHGFDRSPAVDRATWEHLRWD